MYGSFLANRRSGLLRLEGSSDRCRGACCIRFAGMFGSLSQARLKFTNCPWERSGMGRRDSTSKYRRILRFVEGSSAQPLPIAPAAAALGTPWRSSATPPQSAVYGTYTPVSLELVERQGGLGQGQSRNRYLDLQSPAAPPALLAHSDRVMALRAEPPAGAP